MPLPDIANYLMLSVVALHSGTWWSFFEATLLQEQKRGFKSRKFSCQTRGLHTDFGLKIVNEL